MPVQSENPILINGAGIAGLAAALALAQSGQRVIIHEKAEGFDTLGAGLQLSPNATSVLYKLGLHKELEAIASEPGAIQLHSGKSGQRLASIRLGDHARKQYGKPYFVAHRADLQTILFNRCQNSNRIAIRFSSEIIEMAPHKNGVTAMVSENGDISERTAAAIVVADGVWSKLRTKVLKLSSPNYSGKIAWRALMPAAYLPDAEMARSTHVWFGKKSHVVTYPIRGGDSINMVIITAGPEANEGERLTISHQELQNHFKGWRAAFLPLLEQKARWSGWPLFEQPKSGPMHFGAIGLVGDASHAMLPFAAQGAAMAIEDAWVLGQSFKDHDSAHDAMASYEKQRRKRVNRVMELARKNGRIYHLGQPIATARNLVMSMTPDALLAKRQDWIYNWKA